MSVSGLLLYWAGEARQTLMMSDRTAAFDSLPGAFLEVEFGSLCSTTDLCIIYAFVSAIYQPFYTSQLHSTVHLR